MQQFVCCCGWRRFGRCRLLLGLASCSLDSVLCRQLVDLVDVQRFKECNGFAFPGSRTTAQLLQRANSNGEACPTLVEWSNAVYRWRDLRWETLNRGNANNFPVNRCYVHSVPVALMLQGSPVHPVAFYLRRVPTACPGVDFNPVNVD